MSGRRTKAYRRAYGLHLMACENLGRVPMSWREFKRFKSHQRKES